MKAHFLHFREIYIYAFLEVGFIIPHLRYYFLESLEFVKFILFGISIRYIVLRYMPLRFY